MSRTYMALVAITEDGWENGIYTETEQETKLFYNKPYASESPPDMKLPNADVVEFRAKVTVLARATLNDRLEPSETS